MTNKIKNITLVSFPAVILTVLVLESFFRLFIPAAEFPYLIYDKEHRMMLYDRRIKDRGTYTIGKLAKQRGYWEINNYAANGVRFDTELDGHWNVYGHKFVAEQILDRYLADVSR